VWGAGEEARDLIHIDDLVDAVARAIDRQTDSFKLYNIGAGYAVTIKDLVKKIVDASDRELRIEHDLSQPTIKTSLSLDCAKAKRELGWQPRVPLNEGIVRTIAWWKANMG
jgi:nucleoside-diphosphate-sugar epimerase